MSGSFNEIIYAIINVQYRRIQTDLAGNELKQQVKWVFIGVFSASNLGIDWNEWWKVIVDTEILNEILDYTLTYIHVRIIYLFMQALRMEYALCYW